MYGGLQTPEASPITTVVLPSCLRPRCVAKYMPDKRVTWHLCSPSSILIFYTIGVVKAEEGYSLARHMATTTPIFDAGRRVT
jgi:hypothetical protein